MKRSTVNRIVEIIYSQGCPEQGAICSREGEQNETCPIHWREYLESLEEIDEGS